MIGISEEGGFPSHSDLLRRWVSPVSSFQCLFLRLLQGTVPHRPLMHRGNLIQWIQNKRIVLYDTLQKQVTLPELLAILGHEMGEGSLLVDVCDLF